MDVQKDQFPVEILKIIEYVADSHFIAFDLEFSGVAGRRPIAPGGKRSKLTLKEFYNDVKEAAEKYQILQVGVTIVVEDLDRACYVVHPYNFNLNPVPALKERHLGRVWGFHSGAVSFLHDNGFRFDLPITHGVPYLSRKEGAEARTAMKEEDIAKAALPNMPFKEDDLPLLTHIREAVSNWQSKPKKLQEEYLNIPHEVNNPALPSTLDRYQIRLTHQTVRNEFPGLKTQGMGHFVQITNPTNAQLESQQTILDRQHDRDISKAVGFRWLIEAIVGGDISRMPEQYFMTNNAVGGNTNTNTPISKSWFSKLQEKLQSRRKVIVGHNCFTDLVNLYRCFIGDLPPKLEDFQDNINTLFPAVVDTKYLASFGGKPFADTSLGNVYENANRGLIPKIEVAAGFDRYSHVESYHEAGYDSLQTAKVLIKLSAQMQRENGPKVDETRLNTAEVDFGVGEDYVTAPESQSDGGQPTTLLKNLTNAVTAPVFAMKSLVLGDSISSAQPGSAGILSNEAEAGSVKSDIESTSETASSVMAVKKSQLSSTASAPLEIAKIKSKFGSTSLFDVLNAEKADSDDDAKSDLLQWSDDEQTKQDKEEMKRLKKIAHQKRIEKMIEKGEMMPPWDEPNGFWLFFGNKLQCNGTVENICSLP